MAEYFTKDGDNYVKVSDNLLTQADVDSVVESRLERERKKFADYDSLKETAAKVGTIKSEYEDKLKAEAQAKADLEKQLGSAKLDTVKVKALREFGLKDDALEFITGDNEEEIKQRAEKLSKMAPGSGVVIDKKTKPGEKPSESAAIAGKLFGKKSD